MYKPVDGEYYTLAEIERMGLLRTADLFFRPNPKFSGTIAIDANIIPDDVSVSEFAGHLKFYYDGVTWGSIDTFYMSDSMSVDEIFDIYTIPKGVEGIEVNQTFATFKGIPHAVLPRSSDSVYPFRTEHYAKWFEEIQTTWSPLQKSIYEKVKKQRELRMTADMLRVIYIQNHPDRRDCGEGDEWVMNWGQKMGLLSQEELNTHLQTIKDQNR